MLDSVSNQASGLLGFVPHQGPRLLAMVNHGDERAELPLLWQICLALVNWGYPVTVLDATISETAENPGLAQLLDSRQRRDNADNDATGWSVLPAADGIQRLCAQARDGKPRLQRLGPCFPSDSVVIVYSQVDWLIPLIENFRIEPILAVSQSKTSLLTSYLVLKRLLITGKLTPTIVNMIQDSSPTHGDSSQPISASLSACAKRFLDQDVTAINVTESRTQETVNSSTQDLAMRLLERAATLGYDPTNTDMWVGKPSFVNADHFAGSH